MKKLKQLVRDFIEPQRDLGHVDKHQETPDQPPRLKTDDNSISSNERKAETLDEASMPSITKSGSACMMNENKGNKSIAREDCEDCR